MLPGGSNLSLLVWSLPLWCLFKTPWSIWFRSFNYAFMLQFPCLSVCFLSITQHPLPISKEMDSITLIEEEGECCADY